MSFKQIVLATAVAAFVVAGISANDPIIGSFSVADASQLKNPDFEKLLKLIEIRDAYIDKIQKAVATKIEIKKEGIGYHYTISGLVGDAKLEKSFESGKEYQNKRFDGKEYKGKITIIGRTFIREADYGTVKSHHVATFCQKDMELLLTAEKGAEFGKARLSFKRG